MVTKHSWKGKYRRVLSLSKDGLSTHNPGNMEPTNTWKWSDVINVAVLSRHDLSLTTYTQFFLKGTAGF